MASLKANGGDLARIQRTFHLSDGTPVVQTLALCASGWILKKSAFKGARPFCDGWKRFRKVKDGKTPADFVSAFPNFTQV